MKRVHKSDKRVIEANKNQDELHLFYRDTQHTPFIYFGKISLTDYQVSDNAPSKFVFTIEALAAEVDANASKRK